MEGNSLKTPYGKKCKALALIKVFICLGKSAQRSSSDPAVQAVLYKCATVLNCLNNSKKDSASWTEPRKTDNDKKDLWSWYNKLDTELRAKGGQFMKRAVYDKQFKMASVKMAQLGDKSVLETAKELSISASSLRRWINEYDEYGESAFPGLGNALFNSTYEIKKLQKQNEELKLENELLKKLQAFLKQKNV